MLAEQGGANSPIFTVVGVHLAGATTSKTALVRAQLRVGVCWSGQVGLSHELLRPWYEELFPKCELKPRSERERGATPTQGERALIVDAVVSHLGPVPEQGTDERLLNVLEDLGPADIYVFDAPLSLPPCTECDLDCPGALNCRVPEVSHMHEFWRVLRRSGRRLKAPRPYLDRFFEFYARNVFEQGRVRGEVEAVLGSNRAPLMARARFLKKNLQHLFPKARFLETEAHCSSLAWAAHFGLSSGDVSALRAFYGGRLVRQELLTRLAETGRLRCSPALHERVAAELSSQPECFFALISAFSASVLAHGEAFLQPELLHNSSSVKRLPVLPAAVGLLIDRGERSPDAGSEPAEAFQN